jgi:hypothetical protein
LKQGVFSLEVGNKVEPGVYSFEVENSPLAEEKGETEGKGKETGTDNKWESVREVTFKRTL